MSFPDWLDEIATEATRPVVEAFFGHEILLYREDFDGPSLSPSTDYLVKGPLQLGDSGNISTSLTLVPAPGSAPQPSGGGLRLEIDGTQTDVPVTVSLSISPFPTRLQLLRVTAAFRTVPDIAPAAGGWAAGIYVREGDVTDSADGAHRVTATMRVNNGVARLNTPGSTLLPSPAQSPDRFPILYPPAAAVGVDFTLELVLDLAGRTYVPFLDTPGNRDSRQLDHGALPSLWPQTSVGFAVARTGTSGHPAMEVRSFQVSGILEPGFWGRQVAELVKATRRALLPRFVPPRPLR